MAGISQLFLAMDLTQKSGNLEGFGYKILKSEHFMCERKLPMGPIFVKKKKKNGFEWRFAEIRVCRPCLLGKGDRKRDQRPIANKRQRTKRYNKGTFISFDINLMVKF